MNPTHSMNASVAIGLVQNTNPSATATVLRPAATPAARRKILVLGLLVVASCAASVLVFKAAMILNDVFACLDAAYKNGSV
jgi:hypothetical protein